MGTKELSLQVSDLEFLKEESPLGDYFSLADEGQVVQLHDIVTRQPLTPEQLPTGVLGHRSIRRGWEYLEEQGSEGRLKVRLILGGHGGIDDFSNMLMQHHDTLTDPQNTLVGVETDWLVSQNSPYCATNITPKFVDASKSPGRREFQEAQYAWAKANGKILLPVELPDDDESVLAIEQRHLYYDIVEPISQDDSISPAIRHAAATIGYRAYQATRQPALVGNFGQFLRLAHQAQGTTIEQGKEASLILGSWHGLSADRLKKQGVPVEAHTTFHPLWDTPEWLEYGKIMMRASFAGRISLSELRVTPPAR